MANNLLIVESPAKAKTIEKILGKDFKVKSSNGHIRDLPTQDLGVDIDQNFAPKYIVSPEKTKIVSDLRTTVKDCKEVWLATDEDREGEAISWHLAEVLGLDVINTKRVTFREITKSAVQNAIKNPRTIDMNLVNAQQARRVIDRLIGFELSQLLWKKIKGKLSAGRVQSVALKLVVEREREIRNFIATCSFKVYGFFDFEGINKRIISVKADLNTSFDTQIKVEYFLNTVKGSIYSVENISIKPISRNPAPPFTTSTLQQEASIKFGFNVKKTMSLAQKLYESGAITYMRTDSTNLSNVALASIEEYVKNEFGDKYYKYRTYKTKSAGSQEAHEAIRPSEIKNTEAGNNKDEQKLYELIWKRTVASQMASAEIERTDVTIDISKWEKDKFIASGQVIKFDGFLKLYIESIEEEDEESKNILPPLKIGQILNINYIEAIQRYTKPNSRYSEAALVKKLETLGIGRPSTYAPTISRIMEEDKGYVIKDKIEGKERDIIRLILKDEKITSEILKEFYGASVNKLHPTDMGIMVTDFLDERFTKLMDYGFTAEVEKELDEVADKGIDWKKLVSQLYFPFHQDIENATEERGKIKATRILGTDPDSGYTVLVQILRFGPTVQIGTKEEVGEDGKPKFARLPAGMSMETITFDQAMSLFQLPKSLGEYNDNDVTIGTGRYGNYIKYEEKFISLPRTVDLHAMSLEEAIEYIDRKKEEDKPLGDYEGFPITKGKGRFGPYLKWNELFVNVPYKVNIETISMEDAIDLIRKKIDKEANRFIQNWEADGLSIENGRWGPFIKYKKQLFKLPKIDGKNADNNYLMSLTKEQVLEMIENQKPGTVKTKKK